MTHPNPTPELNKRFITTVALAAVSTLAVITVAHSQSTKARPHEAELLKLAQGIVPLPEGDVRGLVALAATYGKAEGQFTGQIVKDMSQKMGSKVDMHVYAVLMQEQVDGCPKVKITFKDLEHPNITSEAATQEIKACSKNN
ncbi:hypothetical protein [Hydromonas duriensis]|uniref:Uncharacterized protein n=1 Tax=Hydromonas duriensis TaxID=1527608 RepID=A0A4R6Y5F5_9BURK|nr:hypothetical protein [Hydromonas duriensis]TDR30297.1 hypothetical protein DFR44_12321 [Hydromonas duriensis]